MIIQDSREQDGLMDDFTLGTILTNVVVEKLDVGDYACRYISGQMAPVVFERKSLGDLYGTMTGGYRRFKQELNRARQVGTLLILGVEAPLSKVADGYPHSNFSGESCVRKVFTLWVKYGLQLVFCRNRKELAMFIQHTFEAIGRVTQGGAHVATPTGAT